MNDNVLNLISEKMNSFSKNQKKIAHYVLDNLNEAAFMTAARIGEAVECSESTVVRFATALGYSGFPEFIKELSDVVKLKLNSVNRIDISDATLTQSRLIRFVMQNDAAKIEDTLKNIDDNTFSQAVDMIERAEKVYIVAVRANVAIAEFLAFYLKMAAKNVVTVTTNSSSEIYEQMIDVSQNDVVIGISFPRYSVRTLRAMEFANERNAQIIAITDSIHSPMNLYSSCNLFARTDMASVVDSLVAPLSLINALIVALCVKNPKRIVERLELLNQVWEDYEGNGKDEINYLDEELMKDLKGLL